MKRINYQSAAILLPALLLLLMFLTLGELHKRPDSGGYILFAKQIVSGEVFEKKELREIRYGRAIRTPGYPLVIAIATGGQPDDNLGNVLVVHALLALFVMVFASLKLGAYCPPVVTGFMILFAEYMMLDLYESIMTEFVAFNILILILVFIVEELQKPAFRNLVLIGLLAATATLMRPAMIVTLTVLPLLLLYRKSVTRRDGLALALMLGPVLLWMSFNQYHIGAFTLTQVSGLNAFGVGTQLGYIEPETGDSEELKEFIEKTNQTKMPAKGTEDEHISNLDPTYKFILLNNTYWINREKYLQTGTIPYDREYLWPYGSRAIKAHPVNYTKYVLYGLGLFFSYGFPGAAILMLAAPLVGLYKKQSLPLCYAALLMFVLHLGFAILTSAYEAVWDRYIVISFYPYLLSVLVCAVNLLLKSGAVQRSIAKLPVAIRNQLTIG